LQEVHLDKHVKLLDSPGIVFPTDGADGEGSTPAAAALRNAVKLEKLADPISPVTEIVKRCKAASLMSIYHIPRFKDAQGFLKEVAVAKGKLKKGGVVDLEKAARMVLQDWSSGKIPYFTMPPQRTGQEYASAAVVKEWGAVFSADDVFKHEASAVIAGLPNMDDSMFIETVRTPHASPSHSCSGSPSAPFPRGLDRATQWHRGDSRGRSCAMWRAALSTARRVDTGRGKFVGLQGLGFKGPCRRTPS
jgi:hypothetical protein